MPDPSARKRLNKKMLDRWENEGGRIATDTTGADANKPTNEKKRHGKKQSSSRDNATDGAFVPATKTRKPPRQ